MNDPDLYSGSLWSVVEDVTNLMKKLEPILTWTDEESVLDVGCGTGDITLKSLLPVIPPKAKLVGVDISKEMVEYARRRSTEARVEYRLQDISQDLTQGSSWEPDAFDKIFSFYCLHLVPNLDLVAKNLYYLMKKDGYLITHFCVTTPFNTVREILSKQAKWRNYLETDEDMSICSMQNADDPCAYYSAFLKDAGFQEISCRTEKFTYHFQDMDQLLNLCKSVTPFLKRVPKYLLDEYLVDVRQVLLRINQVTVEPDGRVQVTWLNMITTARKR